MMGAMAPATTEDEHYGNRVFWSAGEAEFVGTGTQALAGIEGLVQDVSGRGRKRSKSLAAS